MKRKSINGRQCRWSFYKVIKWMCSLKAGSRIMASCFEHSSHGTLEFWITALVMEWLTAIDDLRSVPRCAKKLKQLREILEVLKLGTSSGMSILYSKGGKIRFWYSSVTQFFSGGGGWKLSDLIRKLVPLDISGKFSNSALQIYRKISIGSARFSLIFGSHSQIGFLNSWIGFNNCVLFHFLNFCTYHPSNWVTVYLSP